MTGSDRDIGIGKHHKHFMIRRLFVPASGTTPLHRLLALMAVAIFFLAAANGAFAQQSYKTADEAVEALVDAARSGDQKAALVVLGPDGNDIISSGDKVADEAPARVSSPPTPPSTRSKRMTTITKRH